MFQIESFRRHIAREALCACVVSCLFSGFPLVAKEPGTGKLPSAGSSLAKSDLRSVADIAEQTRPSLVKIIQEGREGMDGLGTGFIISDDGLIATNLHVIGEARRLKVETSDGKQHEVTEIHATDSHLDLALLQVAGKGYKPLILGDSDTVRQGDSIVAMGNPEGLDFSVVEGVLSATREIDGIPMLQMAMPIERGNSGGPVMDRQGRVLGLVTLKSMKTENLGFAMPVNDLKRLIEKPNPVPISRWLTIGVLDRRLWKPMMGSIWTQHAGIIKVAGTPGDGFGGRSLCLWTGDDEPPVDFEVTVTVRLDDEAGAAGLAFCSDGGERHYGFYPSGGKLRLTRFDGPDVYSWTILADVESSSYRPGDWNALRVRVQGDKLTLFVNGRQIHEQLDEGLRGGRVGLCKFRNTKAEFKGFRVGKDLADKPIPDAVVEKVRKSLDGFLESPATTREQTLKQLLEEPGASRRLVAEQRRSLEQQASELRRIERELQRRSIAQDLSKQLALSEDKVRLLHCALLLSKYDNPEVDVGLYERAFDRMVAELKADPAVAKGGRSGVARIRKYLFEENGFHGSRHDYDNRSNSYINEVLDDREGLPITLSVIMIELASRLGVKGVVGLPLPGRFMVGYKQHPEGDFTLIDVFDGGKELTPEQAAMIVMDGGALLPEEALMPAQPRAILIRMINNLLSNALGSGEGGSEAMPYLDLALTIDPDSMAERFTRARLRTSSGDKAGAREDVGWLRDNLPESAPFGAAEQLEQWYQSLAE